jgi:hypothetical protein
MRMACGTKGPGGEFKTIVSVTWLSVEASVE